MKEQSSLKAIAASGVKWRTLSTFISAALQLLQVVVLARFLSPGDFGLFAIAAVVVGLAQKVSDLGVPNAVIQRERPTGEELSSLYWLTIISGIGAFALVALSSPFITTFYGGEGETLAAVKGETLATVLILYSITLVIAPAGLLPYALLQKEMRFKELARIDIASASTGAFASIVSAASGLGVYSFVAGGLMSGVTTAALSLVAKQDLRVSFRMKKTELSGYMGFGLYNTGEKAVSHLMWNLDKLIIGKLLGAEALGFYSVAFQLVQRPLMLINPVVTGVSYPMFALMQRDDARLREAFLKVIRTVSFINAPVYLGMLALAGPIVNLLFGPQWSPAGDVLRVLAFVGFLWSLSEPAGGLFLAKGRASLCFWFNVFALPVYAIAVLVGAKWGIQGVSWGLAAAESLIMTPLNIWLLYNIVGLKPMRYIGACVPYLPISAFMAKKDNRHQ